MRGINKVILLARATRDAELRSTTSGKPVASIRMATNRVGRDNNGERTEHPQYHTVVCWDRLAEQTGKHVKRGRFVYIEGRLETRAFTDKSGKERVVPEVIASDVQFLDAPGTASDDLPPEDRDTDIEANDLDIPF
jgi:single-strand DNA-binding protein